MVRLAAFHVQRRTDSQVRGLLSPGTNLRLEAQLGYGRVDESSTPRADSPTEASSTREAGSIGQACG